MKLRRPHLLLGFPTLLLVFGSVLLGSALLSCSSKYMTVDNADKFKHIDKYDKMIQVKEISDKDAVPSPPRPTQPGSLTTLTTSSSTTTTTLLTGPLKESKRKSKFKTVPQTDGDSAALVSGNPAVVELAKALRPKMDGHRQPRFEDEEGFDGRRPLVDPFHVGEKISMKMTYFGIRAGDISMETKPFVEVNGRKAYHFEFTARSNPSFSSFYAIEDVASAFMDFDLLRPFSYEMHVKETKQLKETRQVFDWVKLENHLWDRKVTKESGTEEKDKTWTIMPFTQNVFTGLYYMRTFKLYPGKHIEFYVADEEHTLLVTGDVIKRVSIDTELGPMKTLMIKPQISLAGVFKPIGDVFFYVTDDDRKALVQIESKVNIGSIKGYLTSFEKGQ